MTRRRGRRLDNGEEYTARQREAQALDLSIAGLSYRQIARSPGPDGKPLYADQGGVSRAIQRALARIPQAAAAEKRQLLEEALNETFARTMQVMLNPPPVLRRNPSTGTYEPVMYPRTRPDGSQQMVPLLDETVRLRAAATYVRVQESYRKLLGLDAAQRFEISGPDGSAIPISVQARELNSRFEEFKRGKLVALPQLTPAAGDPGTAAEAPQAPPGAAGDGVG